MSNSHGSALGLLVLAIILNGYEAVTLKYASIEVTLESKPDGIYLIGQLNGTKTIEGRLAAGTDVTQIDCIGERFCKINDATLSVNLISDGVNIKWETKNLNTTFTDCFQFEDGVQWYGGPQRKEQYWPIQNMSIDHPYVLHQLDNFAVCERYWFNSKGTYIFLDDKVPLFVRQTPKKEVCFIAKTLDPYVQRTRNFLEYNIVFKENAKEAHLHAVNKYLGKPTGHPDRKMIEEPIWTTWAKYKANINDSVVLEFAKSIRDNGYKKGQLEIDDAWENCYGDQRFAPKFNKIVDTVKELKNLDYRVTLWVHPFVDSDCQPNSNEGIDKGYFVKSIDGKTNGTWWNSNDSHQIDFTNPDAAAWYAARLKELQESPGIDAYKFDAGETDYSPQPSVYSEGDPEAAPNTLSSHYIRTCAQFGPLVEVRSAWRTQDLPIFVRMIDKDSNWGIANGLYTLITTLFQMNLNGYTLVLPDMIGGNGYAGETPDAELLVRWTQANTFMPSLQFSYLPWEITNDEFDANAIVKKFVELHANYTDVIVEAMKKSIETGAPVNSPIWWIDPTDEKALACDDEFLLGESILVAPVIQKGATSRNIYLPKGSWVDGNNENVYNGPQTIQNYSAPIQVLPWFYRK